MKGKVQISEEAAIENLRKFFANNPDSIEVTPQDIFVTMHREAKNQERNMSWLSNKLSSMRHYDLFERIYDKTKFGGNKLLKISLTKKGVAAIGRGKLESTVAHTINSGELSSVGLETLETINHLISLVRKKMPNWELELVDDQLVFRPKSVKNNILSQYENLIFTEYKSK